MPRPDKPQGWGANDEPVSARGWGANDTLVWKPVDESPWKPVDESAWRPVAEPPPPKPIGEQPWSPGGVAQTMAGQAGRAISTAASDLNPMNVIGALSNPGGMFLKNQPGPTSPPVGILDKARRLMSGGQGRPPDTDIPIVSDVMRGNIPEAIGHVGALYLGGKLPPVLGRGARAMAEPIAESAISTIPKNRLFGANPGAGVLDNTRGFRPETVRASGQKRLEDLNSQAQQAAIRAPGNASLIPALSVADRDIATAQGANATGTASKLVPMKQYLTEPGPGFTGATVGGKIGPLQSPVQLLKMRTAFPENFNDTYGSEVSHGVRASGRGIYRAMSDEAKRVIPELSGIDPQMHDLIPVVERAAATDAKAGIIQNLIHRLGVAHTGALGAGIGYATHGIPGLIGGAVLPEMIANPTVQMVEARGLNALSKGLKSPAAINAGKSVPLINLTRGKDNQWR